jgi:hypothetical protein
VGPEEEAIGAEGGVSEKEEKIYLPPGRYLRWDEDRKDTSHQK